MTTVTDILITLPTLPVKELEDIRQRCEALLSTISVQETVEDEDWLLASIIEEVKARGLGYTIPDFFKIRKKTAYQGFLRKSEMVRKELTDALPRLKKVEYYALGRQCALALAECLVINQYQPTLDNLLRHVDWVPLALEEMYPGYVCSGMLSLLLKSSGGWIE